MSENENKPDVFLRTPRFLRILISPSAAELYALMKYKRDSLVKSGLIKSNKDWFFYKISDLQEDLVSPNSVNSIKALTDALVKKGLLYTRVKKHPYTIKEYHMDDDAYVRLEKQHRNIWKRKQRKD